ncbi:DUF3486 family protein [Geobacter pelophilus]|uniref:DUF3486 family protein n=1 Tax=Geoanaerobacter pelophilus TaxID=60036 RepID=A0AAW4L5D7_9BACT|nr:DUF3486 family protein [Geoanaerobacter pelophilus]MBT0664767.1 DUF3486 family protein [Geoanaerobacter pelophilus]
MPQVSSIDRLPPDIKTQLQQLLQDPRVTQLGATAKINEILAADGHPERVSKSAVNRYSMQMAEVGEELRQSREIANMWIGKLGTAPEGNVGMLAIEIIKTMSFELAMVLKRGDMDSESAPGTIKMIKELALTCMRLEKSANDNMKREKEIRTQFAEEAAKTASETARAAGVSPDTVDRIWKEVLRMA